MILRTAAIFSLIATLLSPALAQEKVAVGTQQLATSGALFLAASKGYFKAEGLDVEMTAYPAAQAVVEALAGGATDFGVAEFTGAAFNLAGKGAIKAIAAQVREKRDFEGNEIVASNAAYAKGLRKPEQLAGKSLAITELGSVFHFQIGQIAAAKGFDVASVTLKPVQSIDAMARAVGNGDADATILPAQYAREILAANQAKLVGWYSELGEQQLGALFVSATMLETRRATVEKFVRAYRRGAADYAAALMRHDKYGKRITDAASQSAALAIARYVYPGQLLAAAANVVEAGAYYMDPQAQLDGADVARQLEWYKAQGLVDKAPTRAMSSIQISNNFSCANFRCIRLQLCKAPSAQRVTTILPNWPLFSR
jgi:NitT/TauT family transport system substrate-binding protein